jgi:hypothetical protein
VNLLSCRHGPVLAQEGTLDRARSRTPKRWVHCRALQERRPRLSLFQLLDINQALRCPRSDGQATRRIAVLNIEGINQFKPVGDAP